VGIPDVTRPCSFVFLRAGDRVAVSERSDDEKGPYFRPPGGGIEFGETSTDAARRELQEELGLEIDELTPLGVLENLFQLNGRPHHEICFVFEATLEPEMLERLDGAEVMESGAVDVEVVRVMEISALETVTLYPDGVRSLLA
jgi:ADP-ribose pyrophosphatase YjhB (NUDIX family)